METNLHLEFTGDCDAAFAFYETVFSMCTDKFGVSWMVSVPGPSV
jgi:uncharacterized glyoxalase superfamily protein PhnB